MLCAMTKGIHKRDIARHVPPHPANHDRHEERHEYECVSMNIRDGATYCCDKPESHPIHKNRFRHV